MNIVVFGSFGKRMLAPGWTKETAVALAGGGDFDLTGVEPGENARLTAVAVFGGIDIIVDDKVIGHCHPVGRTGGKGVASSIGHVASTSPAYLPIDLAVGAATVAAPWFRQRTRSATMVASTAWVTAAAVGWWRDLPNPWGVTPGPELLAGTTVSAVVIAERFHAEVARVEAYNAATCEGGGA